MVDRNIFFPSEKEIEMEDYLKKIKNSFDKGNNFLLKLEKECPVCKGRGRLTYELDGVPTDVNCLCHEMFHRVRYFESLMNNEPVSKDILQDVHLTELPRMVFFQGPSLSEKNVRFLFYLAIRKNFYDSCRKTSQRPPKIKQGFIQEIIDMTKGEAEESSDKMQARLFYFDLDRICLLSQNQENFMDSVLVGFIDKCYQANQMVWIYQSFKDSHKFNMTREKIKSLGTLISLGSNPNPVTKNNIVSPINKIF